MNRILLFFGILFSFTSLTVNGQKSKIDIGIKGGVNYTNKSIENDLRGLLELSGNFGYYIGTFINLSISEKINLRPELLYILQNSKFDAGITQGLPEYGDPPEFLVAGKIKESLLTIPILLQIKLFKNLYGDVGPSFGYLLKREIEYVEPYLRIGILENTSDQKFEMGLNVGAEYKLTNSIGCGIRYTYGITNRQNAKSSNLLLGMNFIL